MRGVWRPPAFRRLWLLLAAVSAVMLLSLLVWPTSARANVTCGVGAVNLDFGTALNATGRIPYSCTNFDPVPVTFTLCAGIGVPSFPGTPSQPKLQLGAAALDFNVYTDSAATTLWTVTNPITGQVSIPGGIGTTVSGTLQFHGRIPASQTGPVGTYRAFFHNSRLGFSTAGGEPCQTSAPGGLTGVEFSIGVTALISDACVLGTIGAVDFGVQSILGDRLDATGYVQLSCPAARAWTLQFDGGRHAAGEQRRMSNGAGDYVAYALYRDVARQNPISIGGTISGMGSGTVQSQSIYGRIDAGPPPEIGTYSDRVVVILSF